MITRKVAIDCAQNLTILFISNSLKTKESSPYQCQESLVYHDTKKLEDWVYLTKSKWILKIFGVSP
jgi:hypothetical protein